VADGQLADHHPRFATGSPPCRDGDGGPCPRRAGPRYNEFAQRGVASRGPPGPGKSRLAPVMAVLTLRRCRRRAWALDVAVRSLRWSLRGPELPRPL